MRCVAGGQSFLFRRVTHEPLGIFGRRRSSRRRARVSMRPLRTHGAVHTVPVGFMACPISQAVPDPPPPSTVRTLFSYYPELVPAVEPDAAPAPAPAPARRDSRCRMATKLASRAIRHQHAARTAGPIRVRWAGIEFRRLLRCSCKYRQTRHAAGLEGRPRYDSRPNLRLP